jgi:hypothetical protein
MSSDFIWPLRTIVSTAYTTEAEKASFALDTDLARRLALALVEEAANLDNLAAADFEFYRQSNQHRHGFHPSADDDVPLCGRD